MKSGHLSRKLFYISEKILSNARMLSPKLEGSLKKKVNNPTLFQKTIRDMEGTSAFVKLTDQAEKTLWAPSEAQIKYTASTTVHQMLQDLYSKKKSDPTKYNWIPDQYPVVLYKSKRLENSACLKDLNLTEKDHLVICDGKQFYVPVVYLTGKPVFLPVPSCTDTLYVLKLIIQQKWGIEMDDQMLSVSIPNFKPSTDISSSDNERLVDLDIYDQKYYPDDSKMIVTLNYKDKSLEQSKTSQKVQDLADSDFQDLSKDMPHASAEAEDSPSSHDTVYSGNGLPKEQHSKQTSAKYAVSAVSTELGMCVMPDRQKLIGKCILGSNFWDCIDVVTNLLRAPERERSIHELKYHESGREKSCKLSAGLWNLVNQSLLLCSMGLLLS